MSERRDPYVEQYRAYGWTVALESRVITVTLGEPSKWLVDVYIGAPDALPLAPHFLPETWCFGSASKPRSHWLYVAPGAQTDRFTGDDDKLIVELRSTGRHAVMPAGIRLLSDEAVAWDADMADGSERPREVDAAQLADRVVRLALATLNLRNGMAIEAAISAARAARRRDRKASVVVIDGNQKEAP